MTVALLNVSCTISDAWQKRPERVASIIWYDTENKLNYINKVFRDVAHLHNMLSLEEALERQAYASSNFPGCEIVQRGDVYDIKRKTSYDTYLTFSIDTSSADGTWHVSCSAGNRFDLDIAPAMSGEGFVATFNTLYCHASRGSATLNVGYEFEELTDSIGITHEAIITYDGVVTMVDSEASQSRPITTTTKITKPITYRECYGMVNGSMTITCVDEIYNTTDIVEAHIYNDPRRVKLSYYDCEEVIYE